jgi:hypothetical protein
LTGLRLLRSASSTPRVLVSQSSLALGGLLLLALALFPAPVAAQGACPGTITQNYTLSGDLTASATDSNPCITVAADNVMVNLAGHTLDVSALGNSAVAIETGVTNNTAIVGGGGKVVTAYSADSTVPAAAIDTQGGQNVTVTGVDVWNVTSSCTPGNASSTNQRNLNFGTAISVSNVTGASISSNDIECYRVGITVSASNIPRGSTGDISGNILINNTYNNSAAATTVVSAGILLDSSSGWTIQNNNGSYNGSLDGSYACASEATGCSPAIQLTGTSTGNSVLSNSVYNNLGPGIYTGPVTYRNKIQTNIATNNALADLWDAVPPHSSNNWNKNTCGTELGSVSPQKCP